MSHTLSDSDHLSNRYFPSQLPSEYHQSMAEATDPPGTATSDLSPNQRGGLTKRGRTRAAVTAATAQLLQDSEYDDLRVADIAELAGISTATFYQVMRHKAVAVGELVRVEFERLRELLETDLAAMSGAKALSRHLTRLGEYGFRHRTLTGAFCRAYGAEVEGLHRVPSDLSTFVEVVAMAQRAIDRGVQDGSLPTHYGVPDIAAFLTKTALRAFKGDHPENWRTRIDALQALIHLPSNKEPTVAEL